MISLQIADAYQLSQKKKLVTSIIAQQEKMLNFRQQIIEKETNSWKVEFSKGAVRRIKKSIAWVKQHQTKIEAALLT